MIKAKAATDHCCDMRKEFMQITDGGNGLCYLGQGLKLRGTAPDLSVRLVKFLVASLEFGGAFFDISLKIFLDILEFIFPMFQFNVQFLKIILSLPSKKSEETKKE